MLSLWMAGDWSSEDVGLRVSCGMIARIEHQCDNNESYVYLMHFPSRLFVSHVDAHEP